MLDEGRPVGGEVRQVADERGERWVGKHLQRRLGCGQEAGHVLGAVVDGEAATREGVEQLLRHVVCRGGVLGDKAEGVA